MRMVPALILVTTALFVNSAHCALITGFLTDAAGSPVAGADLDVHISATGVKLVTPNDNTTATGSYSISVLPGVYDITYDSPVGSHLLGKRIFNVTVPAGGIIINTSLSNGMVISGSITNSIGLPMDSVNIDLDSLGGGRLYTSNDQTGLTGSYWVVAPIGSYRLRFTPKPGSRSKGAQLDTVLISKDTIINLILPDGFLLSGVVSNSLGQGIAQVAIDLRDQLTGAKVFLGNDKTAVDGSYSVAAPPGLYMLRFTPPAGSRYVPAQIDSVQVSADRIWNQVLPDGILTTVIAQDSAGGPVAGVNVDFKLTSTGAKLYTPNDITDSLGRVIAALAPTLYSMQLDPPLTLPFSLVKFDSVNIRVDTVITVIMPALPRIALSGRIVVPAGSVPTGVKIDLRLSATGTKAVLNNNLADSLGVFSFPAPVGSYDMYLSPPVGSRLVGRIVPSVVLALDTSVGDLAMQIGSLVRSLVLNRDGQPIAGINLDFVEEPSGVIVNTPHDMTDSIGEALVSVLPGSYMVRIKPPVGSPYRPAEYSGLTIEGDSALQFVLISGSDVLPTGPFQLENYPNPFNAQTKIAYTILQGTDATLAVYNLLGELVVRLADGYHDPKRYWVVWDGRNRDGKESGSGVYFVRLGTAKGSDVKKMILVK